jgi:tripartite-type tricarboxylate transporter receptor subunit TctC
LTVAGLMIAAAGGLFASNAQAQGYPTKVITIVVPYTAGGASDVLTRVIAQKLSQAWGQPVIVENKPGASGAIGTNFVAKAAPDGYTFLVSDLGTMTIMPSLKKLPYALEKDLAPVSILSYSPYLLTVNPKLPVNSLKELIDYSKKNPTKLNYASSGMGTNPHMAGMLYAARMGLQWTYIPSKGGAQSITEVIAGNEDLMFNSAFSTANYVKTGKLKVLAVSSAKRLPEFPDAPAIAETLPGFVLGGYQGIFAPAATSPEIVNKLNKEIVRILAMPDVKERLSGLGAEPMGSSSEAMRKFLREDKDRWAKLIQQMNFKLED